MNTFIYALLDPNTDEVRYIGKADNPRFRLGRHLGQHEPRSTHKSNWIKSLTDRGQQPILKILEEIDTLSWEQAEKRWIQHYRALGCNLVNTTEGGEGGATVTKENISEQERERRREAGRRRLTAAWAKTREWKANQ